MAVKEPRRAAQGGNVADARVLADKQREISISEFFTKNRHLLGFDSPAKALLTTIKEAVDNSLDACEEAGILPRIRVEIRPEEDRLASRVNGAGNGETAEKPRPGGGREERHKVVVEDNGPGIVWEQVPRIFGKLLYGSKFHSLRQSRGQQGIGISAAGMYGQLTTGQPVIVYSKTGPDEKAYRFEITLDTKKNEPVFKEVETVWEVERGTRVEITLTGSYKRGQHSVDNYLEQTAIANPHVHLTYVNPRGEERDFARAAEELPAETSEIQPPRSWRRRGSRRAAIRSGWCRTTFAT
jgi:DNA topoisomerase-6 subunit B